VSHGHLEDLLFIVYYLSSLPRSDAKIPRPSGCTDFECKVRVIPADYRPQHYNCYGSSGEVSIPSERVMAIIRDGGIPIVPHNRQELRVGKIAFGTKYVALSHVWLSGSLGNLEGNALPLCQLQNLFQPPRNIRTSIEAAGPSRGHQEFLLGFVDKIMSSLDIYLEAKRITW
jgi:hypothetical protein